MTIIHNEIWMRASSFWRRWERQAFTDGLRLHPWIIFQSFHWPIRWRERERSMTTWWPCCILWLRKCNWKGKPSIIELNCCCCCCRWCCCSCCSELWWRASSWKTVSCSASLDDGDSLLCCAGNAFVRACSLLLFGKTID